MLKSSCFGFRFPSLNLRLDSYADCPRAGNRRRHTRSRKSYFTDNGYRLCTEQPTYIRYKNDFASLLRQALDQCKCLLESIWKAPTSGDVLINSAFLFTHNLTDHAKKYVPQASKISKLCELIPKRVRKRKGFLGVAGARHF